MRNGKKREELLWILLAGMCLTGCSSVGLAHEATFESAFQNTEQPRQSTVGMYDSADTAIVKTVSTEEQKIVLVNIELNKSYTLDYDGTTLVSDKYDSVMSMPQIQVGDIVDVCFMKESKKLVSIKLSPEAFAYESISKYSLDEANGSAAIGDSNYRIKNSALIVSEGKMVEAADVVAKDVVTIKGIGHNIFSIVVEKGHGYLRLKNDAYVIGGWIEVGQSVIQEISDDMLLTVPEGSYDVHITNRGIDTVRKVTIERNKEAVIDLGDIEIEETQIGKVYFTVTPSTAKVSVDGEKADIGKAVEMDYGLHQIMCEASGYDTITQYIKVSQEIASVTITMDETGTKSESSSSGVSDNSLTTGYRVYIDSPSDVEIYQDGIYMGISPVHFPKVAGSHTITLRRAGYVTRSYTIQVDNEECDVTYSFTSLERISDSVSDNSTSGNSSSTDSKDSKDKKGASDNSVSDNNVSGNSAN